MTRAVIDACVLFSAALRDLVMRLTVRFVFQPVWTERIHEEWIRAVLQERPHVQREALERTRRLMNRYGRDWQAPVDAARIPALPLPDEDDRHVLAAAIAAQAPLIVTFNLADFPESVLAAYGVEAVPPDAFFGRLLEQQPEGFLTAMQDLLAGLTHPSRTFQQQLDVFSRLGLPETARHLAAYESEIKS
ncbi:MAG: PIN domain-containing protein [Armatimonadetes bacterium]|nr:PIN domain-containing protein [Armatimonadota bacterium]